MVIGSIIPREAFHMCYLEEILNQVATADSLELSKIVQAVLDRYGALFPDEEVLFLSLPLTDQEERAAILKKAAKISECYE